MSVSLLKAETHTEHLSLPLLAPITEGSCFCFELVRARNLLLSRRLTQLRLSGPLFEQELLQGGACPCRLCCSPRELLLCLSSAEGTGHCHGVTHGPHGPALCLHTCSTMLTCHHSPPLHYLQLQSLQSILPKSCSFGQRTEAPCAQPVPSRGVLSVLCPQRQLAGDHCSGSHRVLMAECKLSPDLQSLAQHPHH